MCVQVLLKWLCTKTCHSGYIILLSFTSFSFKFWARSLEWTYIVGNIFLSLYLKRKYFIYNMDRYG